MQPIKISIGLHYGPVVLGNIGSERRLEYAVLGDTVNVASRLEALTRNLGVSLVLSDDLADAIRNEPNASDEASLSSLENAGLQAVRGRKESINIWTYA